MEPEKKVGRPRKKIVIAGASVAAAVTAAVAEPPPPPKKKIPIAAAPKAARKKIVIKPALEAPSTTQVQTQAQAQIVPGYPIIVTETVTVKVSPITVDGRSLYYNSVKGKIYDLKFKYIGRLKDDKIVPFPDSDAEI